MSRRLSCEKSLDFLMNPYKRQLFPDGICSTNPSKPLLILIKGLHGQKLCKTDNNKYSCLGVLRKEFANQNLSIDSDIAVSNVKGVE